jgi:MFS family permease
MFATLSSFLALYTAVFSLLMGMGLLGTFLSLRMTMAGFSPLATGMVQAAYYLGLVAGSLSCPRLVRRVGHIRAFAALAAVTTATVMLHGIHFSAPGWGVLRLVTGMSNIGLFMVIESWLNECTAPEARGRVFSIYMVLSYLGIGIGQFLLNLGDPRGEGLFFLAGILLALCTVPVSVTSAISPTMPASSRLTLRELLRKTPLGMLGCLTAGLLNSGFYALGPVFGHAIGLNVSQISLLMGAGVLGGLTLQWPVGTVSDRFDRTLVLPVLAALIAILSLVVLLATRASFAALLTAMALYGGIGFTLYPVAVARGHDLFAPAEVVAVSSGLLFSYGVGASIGPVLAAAAMSFGPHGLFAYTALVAGGYAVLAAWLRTLEAVAIVPVAEQGVFMPMKSTSPVAMVIDPRAEPPAEAGGGAPGAD